MKGKKLFNQKLAMSCRAVQAESSDSDGPMLEEDVEGTKKINAWRQSGSVAAQQFNAMVAAHKSTSGSSAAAPPLPAPISMLDPNEDSEFKHTMGLTVVCNNSGLAIQQEQHGLQMDQQSSKTAKLEMQNQSIPIAKTKGCKPLAIQDAGWSKPLSNYAPPISSWSSHDWSSHDWEHVQPSTSREAFFRNMHKVLHHADEPDEQPDEELGAQYEDCTIVERLAKLEGTTEAVSASSEGGTVFPVGICEDEELMVPNSWWKVLGSGHYTIS